MCSNFHYGHEINLSSCRLRRIYFYALVITCIRCTQEQGNSNIDDTKLTTEELHEKRVVAIPLCDYIEPGPKYENSEVLPIPALTRRLEDSDGSNDWTVLPSEHPYRDLSHLAIEEYIAEAGKNISVSCPGINERSLVHDLEWRHHKLSLTLLKYNKDKPTVYYRHKRIHIEPRTYRLAFHPIKGIDGGDYICLFNNNPDAEAVVRLIVYDVPEPPGRPMVLGFTSRTVNISWAPSPNMNNAHIQNYLINMRIGEKGDWSSMATIVTRDNCTTYKLTNLDPYTVYSFRVIGVNEFGPSEPSTDSYYIITLREAPTGKPVITLAHNISSSSIRISWRAPTENTVHGEFLGYRVSYRPRDKPPSAEKDLYIRDTAHRLKMGDEVLSHTITNLEPYTQYLVSLQVFNPQGAGPPTTVLVMTDEGGEYFVNLFVHTSIMLIAPFLSQSKNGYSTSHLFIKGLVTHATTRKLTSI